jgi:serine/threonine protein kinase
VLRLAHTLSRDAHEAHDARDANGGMSYGAADLRITSVPASASAPAKRRKTQQSTMTPTVGYAHVDPVFQVVDGPIAQGQFGGVWAGRVLDGRHTKEVVLKVYHPRVAPEGSIHQHLWHSLCTRGWDAAIIAFHADAPVSHFPMLHKLVVDPKDELRVVVMERGQLSLIDLLLSNDLDDKEVVSIYNGAAAGLEALHQLGYSHGDVKPDNIVVSSVPGGEWVSKYVDFATMRLRRGGTPRNAWHTTGGTESYLAPEVAHYNAAVRARRAAAKGLLLRVLEGGVGSAFSTWCACASVARPSPTATKPKGPHRAPPSFDAAAADIWSLGLVLGATLFRAHLVTTTPMRCDASGEEHDAVVAFRRVQKVTSLPDAIVHPNQWIAWLVREHYYGTAERYPSRCGASTLDVLQALMHLNQTERRIRPLDL